MTPPRTTPSESWYEHEDERDFEDEENARLCRGDEIMDSEREEGL
jgi:hypothetical protein